MKYFINECIVLSRVPEGPLVTLLDGFARFLGAKGYARSTIHRKVLLAACFSQWLEQREIGLSRLTSDHPVRYLSDRALRLRPSDNDATALRYLMGYLRLEGVISVETALVRPIIGVEHCLQAYTLYLRRMRGRRDGGWLHAFRTAFSPALLRRRRCRSIKAKRRGCCGICSTRGGAIDEPEEKETHDYRFTLVPALSGL